jgi:hypothetical protein
MQPAAPHLGNSASHYRAGGRIYLPLMQVAAMPVTRLVVCSCPRLINGIH